MTIAYLHCKLVISSFIFIAWFWMGFFFSSSCKFVYLHWLSLVYTCNKIFQKKYLLFTFFPLPQWHSTFQKSHHSQWYHFNRVQRTHAFRFLWACFASSLEGTNTSALTPLLEGSPCDEQVEYMWYNLLSWCINKLVE